MTTLRSNACVLCGGTVTRPKRWHLLPQHCMASGAIAAPECWQNDSNPLVAECARSVPAARIKSRVGLHLHDALPELVAALRTGKGAVVAYLRELSAEDRYDLVKGVVPALAKHLSDLMSQAGDLPTRPRLQKTFYPESLSPAHLESLQAFEAVLTRLWNAKQDKGHKPPIAYVRRTMNPAIKLSEFAQSQGLERPDLLDKNMVVKFLAANKNVKRSHTFPYMDFLKTQNPFNRGRPARRRGDQKLKGAAPKVPTVLKPDELKAFLAEIEQTRTPAEFLLAWFVCRLGLTVSAARRIQLDQLAVDDEGRLVVRPANVWIRLPRRIESLMRTVVDQAIPGWDAMDRETAGHLTFFDLVILDVGNFGVRVLQGKSKMLRASALYAAMLNGHQDRVTLVQVTGASSAFLTNLEVLLPVDMHITQDPRFVRARNTQLQGADHG